jgi:protoheme IX farnesyltransferase
MKTFFNTIRPYLELCKLKVSLFSAFSSATGFILSALGLKPQIIIVMVGVFILACGASALNQYQERYIDTLMSRTEKRVIPSGRIRPDEALYFSLVLIASGLFTLLFVGNVSAPLLGLSAVLWYNGFYTWLKRKSAFAAVPGALIGAIPPAIGWITGGGKLEDQGLLALCFFFFLWQIPHFWLLVLCHGDDYERAGLPSLLKIFRKSQFPRIIANWIFSLSASCLLLSFSGKRTSLGITVLLTVVSLRLAWDGMKLLRGEKNRRIYPILFRRMNLYLLLVMVSLSIDRLLARAL